MSAIQPKEPAPESSAPVVATGPSIRNRNDVLLHAASYTLSNLEAASSEHLITAPLWFQAQLGESRRLLREAIDQLATPKA